MFKSVFAKYMTAVMAIFIIGFTVLLVVVTSIVGNELSDGKAEDLREIGGAASVCVERAMSQSNSEQFAEQILARLGQDQPLSEQLSAYLVADSDMNILISDHRGRVRFRVSEHAVESVLELLPTSLIEGAAADQPLTEVVFLDSLFDSEVLICNRPIYSEAGELMGYVAVSSSTAPHGKVMWDLISTVVSSALLVLLSVMIALYFISERVTAPLREMSAAARSFADGRFDSRVRVRGNDEVSKLAVSFNNMADSLENLEKMRSSFVANVSHDLRTPMTTIAGFIDGIRDGVIPKEEQGQYLEIISVEVHRLSRLVSSLLDLSRLQAGDRKLSPTGFDVCEMGRVILISFEQKIEEKKLNVEFECDRDRIMIYADHDAVYQVFYNICHNALKFSREGGLLRISLTEKNHQVTVSVYNEGQGIPAEDLPYVFERFYKTDKSRSLDKSGVGLGLFISKTIVEAHGERIWVNSESGKNCEFCFTMPEAPHH